MHLTPRSCLVVRSSAYVALTSLLALGACGGEDKGSALTDTAVVDSTVETDLETTVATILDSFVFEVPDGDGTDPTTATNPTDTGEPDTTPTETSEGCRTFGCQCASNSDCLDELCIEASDGSVCTRTCVADCPPDFDCLTSSNFGDPTTVCVPRHTRLCRPCRLDAECQATNDAYPAYCLAAENPDQGSFCGSSCANRDCPEGYECADAPTTGGGTARQCVPSSGMCECRPSWAALGFSTDCVTRNAVGGCEGTRQCGAGGLTACTGAQAATETCDGADNDCNGTSDDIAATACTVDNGFGHCPGTMGCNGNSTVCVGPQPAAESCNGEDDNCNDQTDEAGCDDSLICTVDTCAGPGNCQHAIQGGYCVINNACWLSPQYNPQNACEQCDANKNTTAWSQTPNTCSIGGACYPASAVNPQNACQICNPNQSTTSWTTATNTCQIGGQCYLQNAANPANTCEICAPASSTTTWTLAFNTCNIQGQCYAAGLKKPGESCYQCDPSRSTTGWSTVANGTSCDDNNACSPAVTDKCNGAGVCLGDTACDDKLSCTANACNPQVGCSNTTISTGCLIDGVCRADQFQNPQNQCQWCDSSKSKTSWSNKPTGTACNDGLYCTDPDTCSAAGVCGGAARNCADTLACTSDACNETTDACTHTLTANNCLINGTCYAGGTAEPGNVCRKCTPASSTLAWSLNNGASCNDNDACSDSDVCSNNVCDGTDKSDSYESNNTASSPNNLGVELAANFNSFMPAFNARLYGVGDEDWYIYRANDNGPTQVQPFPEVKLENIPANANYDLCVYWDCDDPGYGEQVDCQAGSASDLTLAGETHHGCCSTNSGSAAERVKIKAGCDTTHAVFGSDSDVGTVYIRVLNAGGAWTCDQYSLTYGEN